MWTRRPPPSAWALARSCQWRTAKRLSCAAELDQVNLILEHGASYQRQLRVAEENGGSLKAVVASLTRELRHGLGKA